MAKQIKDAKKAASDENPEPPKEMSFLDHLEELRWHLVRSLVAILLVAIVIFIYRNWVTDNIYLAPYGRDFPLYQWLAEMGIKDFGGINVTTQAIGPYDQFLLALGMAFMGGFIVAFPYILWEFWRFLKPGLHNHERNRFRGAVFILSVLFFAGIAFGYYIIVPFSVSFLADFQLSAAVENQWRINKVISMINQIVIAGGLVFEMPVLVYILSKMGVVTPDAMKRYWRHATVVLLLLSALITPPDVLSQVLIFIPLAILYRFSIAISAFVNRKREKELE
ncbi:MAG: twin-arginine translocase subunit TatC [Bacteroidia bacterium]